MVTVLALVLVLVLSGDLALPLPNLLGGPDLALPLALFLPLVVTIVVAYGLTSGDPRLEAVASRPLPALDDLLVLLIALVTLASCGLVGLSMGFDLALASGRNVLGYLGLTLIARRLAGASVAPLLPISFALVCALLGSGPDAQPRWWAWPIASSETRHAWGLSSALLVLGLVVALAPGSLASTED